MNPEEHRKHPRIDSINLSYICLDQGENVVQQAMARTINISNSGLLIETHFQMKTGYTLVASIGIHDEVIDIKGKVVHVHRTDGGKYVSGVEITDIENKDASLWTDFISRISSAESDSSAQK